MSTTDAVRIYNSDLSSVYTFPCPSESSGGMQAYEDELGFRVNYVGRSYSHGAVNASDRKLNARSVSVKGYVQKSTRSAYLTELDTMQYWCYVAHDNPGTYRLVLPKFNDDTAIPAVRWKPARFYYIDSVIGIIKTEHADGITAEIEIIFGIADPFAYAWRESNKLAAGLAYNVTNTVNVALPALVQPTVPKIRIDVTAGTLRKFQIKNSTNNDTSEYMMFGWWKGIETGEAVEVDMSDGTCTIITSSEVIDGIKYLYGPYFYPLKAGDNQIKCKVLGDAGTTYSLTHIWRNRWL